jgi:hypothetical protein
MLGRITPIGTPIGAPISHSPSPAAPPRGHPASQPPALPYLAGSCALDGRTGQLFPVCIVHLVDQKRQHLVRLGLVQHRRDGVEITAIEGARVFVQRPLPREARRPIRSLPTHNLVASLLVHCLHLCPAGRLT